MENKSIPFTDNSKSVLKENDSDLDNDEPKRSNNLSNSLLKTNDSGKNNDERRISKDDSKSSLKEKDSDVYNDESKTSVDDSKSSLKENDSLKSNDESETTEQDSKSLSKENNSYESKDELNTSTDDSKSSFKGNEILKSNDEPLKSKDDTKSLLKEHDSDKENEEFKRSKNDLKIPLSEDDSLIDENKPGPALDELKSSLKKKDSGKSKDDSKTVSKRKSLDLKRDFIVPPELLRPSLEKTATSRDKISTNRFDSSKNYSSKMSLKVDGNEEMIDEDETSKVNKKVSFKDRQSHSKEITPTTQMNTDVSGKYPNENQDSPSNDITEKSPVNVPYASKRPPVRRSFVRRKLIALEKELTLENINKRVIRVFSPDIPEEDSEGTGKDENQGKPQRSYMSSTMACIFLISVITGSAISSLPYYLRMSDWLGVFLLLLLGINAMYGGLCVGWCWSIMEEISPEYEEYSRIPYQDIAYRATGKFMKYFVGFIVDLSVIGTCAVFMIEIADSLETLSSPPLHFCHLMLITTAILLPFSMFASYRNMKFIGVLDVILCVLFTFFLILTLFLDKPSRGQSTYSNTDFDSLVLSFTGLSFAYGYGPPLSNILMDMENRSLFTHSVATASLFVVVIYVLIAIMGYAAYGDETASCIVTMILSSSTQRSMGIFLIVLYFLQMMTTFVCFLLPSLLQFEERVNCPDRFGVYRFLLRLTIIACVLIIILGIPDITMYVEVVSGLSMNLMTFILPPIFYVCLVYQRADKAKWKINRKEWLLIVETILVGLVIAIMSVIKRTDILKTSTFTRSSCYTSNMTNNTKT